MSRIEEAIQKLEKVADRHICSSWIEQLQEITFLLKKKV
jgi:outer membrane protein assembly factor BamD (BamD/ComL family)